MAYVLGTVQVALGKHRHLYLNLYSWGGMLEMEFHCFLLEKLLNGSHACG